MATIVVFVTTQCC